MLSPGVCYYTPSYTVVNAELTQPGFHDLDLLYHFDDLRGVLRVLPTGFFCLGYLLLEAVLVLVQEVDARATVAPLGVQVYHLRVGR